MQSTAPTRASHRRRVASALLALSLPLAATAMLHSPAEAAPKGKPRTALTLKAPKTTFTSSKVTLSGKATAGGTRRTVRVEVRKAGRWKRVTTRRTDTRGRFTIKVGTPDFPTTRRYRVSVLSTTTRAAARATRTVKVLQAPPAPQTPTPKPADFRATWDATQVSAGPGAGFTATGTVPGTTGRKRKVVLQRKHTDEWRTVARATTNGAGRFTLRAPGDWLVNLEHRVYVPKNSKGRKRFSQATRLRAVPGWNPQGLENDWAALKTPDGRSYRWNPCRGPIRYRVNSALAPAFVTPEFVDRVVADVAQATGLTFTRLGSTTAHAFPLPRQPWPSDTDLVISWSNNDQTASPITGNQVQGRGGVAGRDANDARGQVINVTEGHVLLKPDSRFLQNEAATFGVLKHELGHAVGLAHAPSDNGEQLMDAYFTPVRGADWGRGDLAGLRRHGATTGCVQAWNFGSGSVTAPEPSGLLPITPNSSADATEAPAPEALGQESEYAGRLHTASMR